MTDMSRDEDRLPWLEAVDDEGADDRVSTAKLVAFVVATIAALAIVVGGVWFMRAQDAELKGDGKLIAAPAGDYKERPDTPGGMKVEGQGDSAFAASEGAEADGKIDLAAAPEAPLKAEKPAASAPASDAPARSVATASVAAPGGKLVAPPPVRAQSGRGAAAAEGSLVQLGAFDSEAVANATWVKLTKRFAYLAPLEKNIVTAEVGGRTYYRLRANAAGDAASVCGKLRVAGENCLVVN